MSKYGPLKYGSSKYGIMNYKLNLLYDLDLIVHHSIDLNIDSKISITNSKAIDTDSIITIHSDYSYLSDNIIGIFTSTEVFKDILISTGELVYSESDVHYTFTKNLDTLGDNLISIFMNKQLTSDFLIVYGTFLIKEATYDMTVKIWTNVLINNYDLSSHGFTLLRDTEVDLLPSVSIRSVEIPNRDGCIIVGKKIDERNIQLGLALNCTDEESFTSAKRFLAKLLSDELDLVFDEEPGRHYFCRYSGDITIQEWIMNGFLTIPLVMSDPYIYGDEKEFAGVGSLEVNGTEQIDMIIEVQGPVVGPLTISINDITLTMESGLSDSDILRIDTSGPTVELNGEEAMAEIEGEFPMLNPGVNEISCSTNSLVIRYREKWLS
jgi:predicted phage tail component-like protein